MLAEQALEDGTCPHCGQARELCEDPSQRWYPVRLVCHATMATRKAQRDYRERHDGDKKLTWHNGDFSAWSTDWSEQTPYRYDDGVTIVVASEDIAPDDDFLTGKLKRALMNG